MSDGATRSTLSGCFNTRLARQLGMRSWILLLVLCSCLVLTAMSAAWLCFTAPWDQPEPMPETYPEPMPERDQPEPMPETYPEPMPERDQPESMQETYRTLWT